MSKKITTITAVKRLATPASGFTETAVGTVPGLRVRVLSSGVRSFVFRYKANGKQNVITLGRVDDAQSMHDAEAKAKELRSAVSFGHDPAQAIRERKTAAEAIQRADELNPLFKDLAADYIKRHAKPHNQSWYVAEHRLKVYVTPKIGHLRVKAVTRRDVVNLLNGIADTGAVVMANRVRSLLSGLFNWAIKQAVLDTNPATLTERRPEHARERVLSDDDIRLLWGADGCMSALALKMILLSGQRPGEVASMRWEHVRDDVWTLARTKNGKSHRVPVSLGMWKVLDEVKALPSYKSTGTGFVFPGARTHITTGAMSKLMRRMGFHERTTPHDLRRTCATTISRLGHPRIIITKLLNHTETHVDAVYDRWSYLPETLKALDDVWAEVRRIVRGADVLPFPSVARSQGG